MWAYCRLKLRSPSRKGCEELVYVDTGTRAKVALLADGGESRVWALWAACSENMAALDASRPGCSRQGVSHCENTDMFLQPLPTLMCLHCTHRHWEQREELPPTPYMAQDGISEVSCAGNQSAPRNSHPERGGRKCFSHPELSKPTQATTVCLTSPPAQLTRVPDSRPCVPILLPCTCSISGHEGSLLSHKSVIK